MIVELTDKQTEAMLELIDQMYDNDSLIEETVELLCESDERVREATSIGKKDMLRFLLTELSDVKYAYLRGEC